MALSACVGADLPMNGYRCGWMGKMPQGRGRRWGENMAVEIEIG